MGSQEAEARREEERCEQKEGHKMMLSLGSHLNAHSHQRTTLGWLALASTCEWRIKAKVEISARTEQRTTNQRTKIKRHYVEKIQSVHKQAKSNGSKRVYVCGSPLHPRSSVCELRSSSSRAAATQTTTTSPSTTFCLCAFYMYSLCHCIWVCVRVYINQLKLT